METARADAHIHLFEGGYRSSFTARPGVQMDEGACYDSLARDHGVRVALVVGYAALPWCVENNAWIARQSRQYPWARPLAYADPTQPPDVEWLEGRRAEGFAGLSMYVLEEGVAGALADVPDEVWMWLEARRWLLSVNSRGALWRAWYPILERHGGLRLLASHLGQPPRVSRPPTAREASEALEPVLGLAEAPGPGVKISGLYSITEPRYDYPHRAAWPYVEALLARFGAGRLLWGSDYTPCLDNLSFAQTLGFLAQLPFLSAEERRAIEGENLLGLLEEQGRVSEGAGG